MVHAGAHRRDHDDLELLRGETEGLRLEHSARCARVVHELGRAVDCNGEQLRSLIGHLSRSGVLEPTPSSPDRLIGRIVAPFDGIVVTAAVSQIPPPLLEQLKPGGRMVIPIGAAFLVQQLMLIEKLADGSIRTEALLPVAFVPLVGRH